MVDEVHSLPSPQSESGYDVGLDMKARILSMTPATEPHPDPSSADESSVPGGSTGQRTHMPPRNDDGKIICQHPNATSACSELIFDRRCEWSKHMDKHERPYVCDEPGCEKLRGFTYSGGLLRHKREVHKKHGGPKETLMCPYPYCKRSTGHGFTRRENLNEHVRRVHRPAPGISATGENGQIGQLGQISPTKGENNALPSVYAAALPFDLNATPAPTRRPRKRKAPDSPAPTESPAMDGSLEQIELREEIKRLRRDAEEKDLRIQKLESDLSLFMSQHREQQHQHQHQHQHSQQLEPQPESRQEQEQEQQERSSNPNPNPHETEVAPQTSSGA